MHDETLIGSVPHEAEPFFLAEQLSSQDNSCARSCAVYVVSDSQKIVSAVSVLKKLLPEWSVLPFSPWAHTPYEMIVPSVSLVEERFSTLAALISPTSPVLVVTTPVALSGFTVPRDLLKLSSLHHTKQHPCTRSQVLNFLKISNYQHVSAVQTVGEYSVRGGIIDAYFVGQKNPLRLDFFDEELETIKTFSPETQVTTESIHSFSMLPASEVVLTSETQALFRQRYRQKAGVQAYNDPLYEAVTEGVMVPGIESYLPLFYESPGTLLSYIQDATIFYNVRTFDILDAYILKLEESYTFRKGQAKDQRQGLLLPVHELAQDRSSLISQLSRYKTIKTSPFKVGDGIDYGAKPAPFLGQHNTKMDQFYKLKEIIETQKKPVFITIPTEDDKNYLVHALKKSKIPMRVADRLSADSSPGTAHLLDLGESEGFEHKKYILCAAHSLQGKQHGRRPSARPKGKEIFEISAFQVGDFLIHEEHGVGQYLGLETIEIHKAKHDCVVLLYQDNAKLFVPVENFYTLSFYASQLSEITLDRLGGAQWKKRREAAQKKIMEIAEKLSALAAKRKLVTAESFYPTPFFSNFCDGFPHPETDDQLRAIDDVIVDLAGTTPMDRLICGDVGFGKTEVALRAAFIVAAGGAQVAILAPTTILAKQHYETLKDRFKVFDLKIGFLSRFQNPQAIKSLADEIKAGEIDIVVGTHALLSGKVSFFKLGLLIVDEEQHFGVKQKEKIKSQHPHVHILSLSATPIPRTMQMAVSGIRDLSLIATPPVERVPVETWVVPYDMLTIKEALIREKSRGGQSFFVCPRVTDIAGIVEDLKKILPNLIYGVAHGQLSPKDLEQVMIDFCDQKIDVLVSTNIIESGLDIPSANTIIIHKSDLFGLAQIYQLRGRVGRSHIQGYAYFTFNAQKTLSDNATKRLQVLESLRSLGGGFQIASYDMDIRGTGNIVGEAQSGQIKHVGVGLYHQMLEESLLSLKNKHNSEDWDLSHWVPQIHLGLEVMIPEKYIQDESLRFKIYRRLSSLKMKEEIQDFLYEMADRFGPLPLAFLNLISTVELRNLCKELNIEKIDKGPNGILLGFYKNKFHNVDSLMQVISDEKGTVKLRPDQKVVIFKRWAEEELIDKLIALLGRLLPKG